MKITTIGIDLAKNVFQVHGVDEQSGPRKFEQCDRWIFCSMRRSYASEYGAEHDTQIPS
jgi:hypothetical protein